MKKGKRFSQISFFVIYQIPKINIFHKVMRKHPEVIKGRWRLISTDIIDPDEEVEDGVVDYGAADLGEEDECGPGAVGATIYITGIIRK